MIKEASKIKKNHYNFFLVEILDKKTKWVFSDDPNHYYLRDSKNLSNWKEFVKNVSTIDLVLKTYDGDKIILYHVKQRRYIQIDEKKVSIAAEYIENLDNPDFIYDGQWLDMSYRSFNEQGIFNF